MDKKSASVAAYNKMTTDKVIVTDEVRIRFAVMSCYMALIQEIEKYVRYTPFMFGWWRNVFSSMLFYHEGFKELKLLKDRLK